MVPEPAHDSVIAGVDSRTTSRTRRRPMRCCRAVGISGVQELLSCRTTGPDGREGPSRSGASAWMRRTSSRAAASGSRPDSRAHLTSLAVAAASSPEQSVLRTGTKRRPTGRPPPTGRWRAGTAGGLGQPGYPGAEHLGVEVEQASWRRRGGPCGCVLVAGPRHSFEHRQRGLDFAEAVPVAIPSKRPPGRTPAAARLRKKPCTESALGSRLTRTKPSSLRREPEAKYGGSALDRRPRHLAEVCRSNPGKSGDSAKDCPAVSSVRYVDS